jgi:hypothetical protein
MGASYDLSARLREEKSESWYKYHVAFHFSTMMSQMFVLKGIINYVEEVIA